MRFPTRFRTTPAAEAKAVRECVIRLRILGAVGTVALMLFLPIRRLRDAIAWATALTFFPILRDILPDTDTAAAVIRCATRLSTLPVAVTTDAMTRFPILLRMLAWAKEIVTMMTFRCCVAAIRDREKRTNETRWVIWRVLVAIVGQVAVTNFPIRRLMEAAAETVAVMACM